ncbi:carboxypeptidase regulatory-like domain-containing protein [Candidatus Micrarchaeota archaeon]|nr:carboxypeptidase regulatory-like domain-containing protein [Candidatus Micrarchaeota archaeon]
MAKVRMDILRHIGRIVNAIARASDKTIITIEIVTFLVIFTLAGGLALMQQNTTIEFTVVEQTNHPINGATITLLDEKGAYVADTRVENGRAVLRKIKTGQYTLQVSAPGFATVSRIINTAAYQKISIQMKAKTASFPTATPKPEPKTEATATPWASPSPSLQSNPPQNPPYRESEQEEQRPTWPSATPTVAPSAEPTPSPTPPEASAIPTPLPEWAGSIGQAWQSSRPVLTESIESNLRLGNPYILYDVETQTINLLEYAARYPDYAMLDQLAQLYSSSFAHLNRTPDGTRQWLCGGPACTVYDSSTYHDQEVMLVSLQFIHPLARMLHEITKVPPAVRTAAMNEFTSKATPIVVTDHLQRWMYGPKRWEVRGWGCRFENDTQIGGVTIPKGTRVDGDYNLYEYVEAKLNRSLGDTPGYCNAVTDWELWAASAASETLAAHQRDAQTVPLTAEQVRQLTRFVDAMTRLLQDRTSLKPLTDFQGNAVYGLNVDLGAWDQHPENAYAGYAGAEFPTEAQKMPTQNAGWDVSHGRRFVNVFESLHANRNATGQTFPDAADMKRLANQFAYGAFNKDFDKPRFSNFMDGSDGWYRVGYHGPGYGYAPGALSKDALEGGYGTWSQYNPDVKAALETIWKFFMIPGMADDSGNKNNGYGLSDLVPSASGKAIRLDGKNGGVLVPDSPTLRNLAAFTFEAEINLSVTNKTSLHTILAKGVEAALPHAWLALDLRPDSPLYGKIFLQMGDAKGTYSMRDQPLDWQTGRRYHVAATWDDASKTFRLYRDGQPVGQDYLPQITSGHTGIQPLWIGAYYDGANHVLEGTMDNVRIWNRTLTAEEVRKRSEGQELESGTPVASYGFDEDKSTYSIEQRRHYLAYYRDSITDLGQLMVLPSLAMPAGPPLSDARFEESFDSLEQTRQNQGIAVNVQTVPGRTGNAALFAPGASLTYPSEGRINIRQGTMDFWVKPNWNGSDGQFHPFFYALKEPLSQVMAVGKFTTGNLSFFIWRDPKTLSQVATDVSDWQPGQWHRVQTSWNETTIALTVDGRIIGQQRAVLPNESTATIGIGFYNVSGDYYSADATLDEFNIRTGKKVPN